MQMHAGLDFVEAGRKYRLVYSNPDSTQQDKADAREELVRYAAARFDVELEAKQQEIDQLEHRLQQLRASVQQIEESRDNEIAQMVLGAERIAQRQTRQQRQNQDESGND